MKKEKQNRKCCPRCKSTDLYFSSGDFGEEYYCRHCHTYFDKKK